MREDESLDSREQVVGRVVFCLSRYVLTAESDRRWEISLLEGEESLRSFQKNNEFWRMIYMDKV